MKRVVIEVPEPGDERQLCGFDVVLEDGTRCNGLGWDEMVGQVVSLTHPRLDGRPQYQMLTSKQWADRNEQMGRAIAARQAPPLPLPSPKSTPLYWPLTFDDPGVAP